MCDVYVNGAQRESQCLVLRVVPARHRHRGCPLSGAMTAPQVTTITPGSLSLPVSTTTETPLE